MLQLHIQVLYRNISTFLDISILNLNTHDHNYAISRDISTLHLSPIIFNLIITMSSPPKWTSSPSWRNQRPASPGSSPTLGLTKSERTLSTSPSTPSSLSWRTSRGTTSSPKRNQQSRNWSPSSKPSPSPSRSRSPLSSFPSPKYKRNTPFKDAPFPIQLSSSYGPVPGFFNDADKRSDWDEEWSFTQNRIKQRGNPTRNGFQAEEVRIHDWWHSSDGDLREHLLVLYMYNRNLPECPVENGGGCYIKLHIYRTDEEERQETNVSPFRRHSTPW